MIIIIQQEKYGSGPFYNKHYSIVIIPSYEKSLLKHFFFTFYLLTWKMGPEAPKAWLGH